MGFTVLNNSDQPVEIEDLDGKIHAVQSKGTITLAALMRRGYEAIVAGKLQLIALLSDNERSVSAMRAWHDRLALDTPYPVTCVAGAAILSAAQVSVLSPPAIGVVAISAAGAISVGTATTTPILPDGINGQRLTLLNVGSNTITISDQGTMAASNLRLTAATVAIAARQSVDLMFSSAIGDWVQTRTLTAVI